MGRRGEESRGVFGLSNLQGRARDGTGLCGWWPWVMTVLKLTLGWKVKAFTVFAIGISCSWARRPRPLGCPRKHADTHLRENSLPSTCRKPGGRISIGKLGLLSLSCSVIMQCGYLSGVTRLLGIPIQQLQGITRS